MADELKPGVKSASQRFGWHLAGSSVGLFRDLFFMTGDLISRTGEVANRFAEVGFSFLSRKNMYRLALDIRQRRDHQNPGNSTESGTEKPLSRAENFWFYASAPFIGVALRKTGHAPMDVNDTSYDYFIPGILSLAMTAVEWTAKIPGTVLLGIGGGVKLIARAFGHARNYLLDRADYTTEERHLRAAEHTFVNNLNEVFAGLDRDDRQKQKMDMTTGNMIQVTKDYPGITKLLSAAALKQLGYIVALPGRAINAVGRAISSLNLWINDGLDIVSRFGDKTFLDYAKQLHTAMGNQRGVFSHLGDRQFTAAAKSLGTLALFAVSGVVGAALKYAPKVLSFINNLLYTGIPGFALEYIGKGVAAPGNFVYALGQKMVPDTKQRKLLLDGPDADNEFDFSDSNAIETKDQIEKPDVGLGLVDPEQLLSVKDTLYRTFVRDGASKARAYKSGIQELRSTYHMLHAKAGDAKSEEAADAAVKAANGVIAQEMMGHHYGYGDSHGKHPVANDPMLDDIKDEISSNLDEIRKPTFNGTAKGYWAKRSWIARQVIDKVSTLDDTTNAELGLPYKADTHNNPVTDNNGYDVKSPLLS